MEKMTPEQWADAVSMDKVGERLRQVRTERSISQSEIRRKATEDFGVVFSTALLSRIETGRHGEAVPVNLFPTVAEILGVHLVWLLTGEGLCCTWCGDSPFMGYQCLSCRKVGPADDSDN